MAGLLAAHMLRRHNPVIHEAQPALPNNHHALLRFRSDAVSRATGIPFRKVRVSKSVMWLGEHMTKVPLHLANMYSQKVTGEVHDRSVLNLEPAERWIAPPDFINQLSHIGITVQLNAPLKQDYELLNRMDPSISTIPMDRMMDIIGWPDRPQFKYQQVWTINAEISQPVVDVYQTIYYPGADRLAYRASLTGRLLTLEYSNQPSDTASFLMREVEESMRDFGVSTRVLVREPPTLSYQKYGKLAPIDPRVRRAFILALTDRYNTYSLGRFATWRQILLDDVVHDIQVIERFINERDDYERMLKTRGGF